MMKIESETWFGSLDGEADMTFAQIAIWIVVSMVIIALKDTLAQARKRLRKGDK